MRVLFVSGELVAGNVAYRLKQEGCQVKLWVGHPEQQDCLEGLVEKTADWKKELGWVGKDGLIVFDDVGYGAVQDALRKDGYRVFGGSAGADRLELERSFGQNIFASLGMKQAPNFDFRNPNEAAQFVREHPATWVVKQNTHQSALNYVGQLQDGSDVLSVLERYEKSGVGSVALQKVLKGVEVSINRYFNGHDWVGPCEITLEHKALMNGDIGPKTGEMGNLMWYDDACGKLFAETIGRLKPYLQKTGFRGDIDINSFISEEGVFPIEATARLGCPITHSQSVMHLSPWHEFLYAVASGESYELKHREGYCIALTMALPPFPYEGKLNPEYSSAGLEIFFRERLTSDDWNNIHFEAVKRIGEGDAARFFVTRGIGWTVFVTGYGRTVEDARDSVYTLARKIIIPKIFYRTDIGQKFLDHDRARLSSWGWIE